jgi:hypothetical protein
MARRLDVGDLAEFRRALAALGPGLAAAEHTFEGQAASRIVRRAIATARSLGSVAAKAATDVQTGARGVVDYGGRPYDMGAEFGAYRYKQFKTWRGNQDNAGYFLWPSARWFRDQEAEREFSALVMRTFQTAFPE